MTPDRHSRQHDRSGTEIAVAFDPDSGKMERGMQDRPRAMVKCV